MVYREDLLRRMQRHLLPISPLSAALPADEAAFDVAEQLVTCVLDQAHLCPLPASVRPIIWDLDYTLRLFPLPHLVSNVWPGRFTPSPYVMTCDSPSHSAICVLFKFIFSFQLIISDSSCEQFQHVYKGCQVVNPGLKYNNIYLAKVIVTNRAVHVLFSL